jgi:hypothetical protein
MARIDPDERDAVTERRGVYQHEELIRTYFNHLIVPENSQYYDVVEYVDELVRADPQRAWNVVRSLIEIARSDEDLAYVAAGPLENLLALDDMEVLKAIRQDALQNERVRNALGRVLLFPRHADLQKFLGTWLPPAPLDDAQR